MSRSVTVNNIFKLTFHTENTLFVLTTTNWVSLFREKIYINSKNYTKSINIICGQYAAVVNINESDAWDL